MCRRPSTEAMRFLASTNPRRVQKEPMLVVFGRVEPDLTGRLVASATSFDHIKYVDSIEEGRLHVEAIWALEQSSAGGE